MMLGTVTGVFAARLLGHSVQVGSPAVRLWGAAFAASAAAAVMGGFFHGFGPQLGDRAAALWLATLYAGGATSFFLMAATVTAVLRGMTRRVWLVAMAAKASAYAAWVTHDPDFRWLVFDYGTAMLGVAAFQTVRRRRGDAPGAGWIRAGIAGSFVAALVQQSGLSPHERFNHNDLYHVLQIGATALLYRGGREMTEPERSSSAAPASGLDAPARGR